MNNLVYIWFATGILFLLIEMVTATFYGLAVSIAGFVLAIYTYFSWDMTVTIPQGILLVIVSTFLAYFLPKWLHPNTIEMKTGLDAHVGHSFSLEKVGNDWKVKIEWVDYLVSDESVTEDFSVGKKVEITSQNAGVLMVVVKK